MSSCIRAGVPPEALFKAATTRSRAAKLLTSLLLVGLLIGCGGATSRGGSNRSDNFRIVGYVTAAAAVETIDFSQLTHVNYAFLLPKKSGELKPFNSTRHLQRVTEAAHGAGVKVLISVGGWGSDAEFEALAAAPERRAVLIGALVDFVSQYQLDGVDIDWEYPDAGSSSDAYLALMGELRAALPESVLLTTAVVADAAHADGINPAVFPFVDFVNIMAYDGGPSDHSSIALAQQALNSWDAAGLPKEKRLLGVPFYARPGDISYRKLLEADPAAADGDTILYFSEEQNYNGPATLRAKVALARAQGAGIMIWELSQDALGSASLLKVIWEASQ
jgi:GH18 family chitinase